jgi:predicted peroxiredoxin
MAYSPRKSKKPKSKPKRKPKPRPRQIFIVKTGADANGVAGLAFAHAAYAASMNYEVMIFLVIDGGRWAYTNYGKEYQHSCFNEPYDNLTNCIGLGCKVVLCATCFDVLNQEVSMGEIKEGIEVGGLKDVQEFCKKPCASITY